MLYYTRGLKCEQKPDYSYLTGLLEEVLIELIPLKKVYDWIEEPSKTEESKQQQQQQLIDKTTKEEDDNEDAVACEDTDGKRFKEFSVSGDKPELQVGKAELEANIPVERIDVPCFKEMIGKTKLNVMTMWPQSNTGKSQKTPRVSPFNNKVLISRIKNCLKYKSYKTCDVMSLG